jgi:hypothetical protein
MSPILRLMKVLPVFHDEYMGAVNDYCKYADKSILAIWAEKHGYSSSAV